MIEKVSRETKPSPVVDPMEVAARIAADIPAGSYVNLGIGQPTLVAEFLSDRSDTVLHTENGMLGMGALADHHNLDPDLTNAGKQFVTEKAGCSYFHHADSFTMIRGGHIDFCILGAFQVSVHGDLANWSTGASDAIPAVGGAMDLAVGARNVYVMMPLLSKDGHSKIVSECTYPLTAPRCVSRVYTDHAIFDLEGGNVIVNESFGVSHADLEDLVGIRLLTRRE